MFSTSKERASALLVALTLSAANASAESASTLGQEAVIVGDGSLAAQAVGIVDAYHRLDTGALAPRLEEGFRYLEEGLGKDLDAAGFLAFVVEEAKGFEDRELEVRWVGVIPPPEVGGPAIVDLRGQWRARPKGKDKQISMAFSMRLELASATDSAEPATGASASPPQQVLSSWTSFFSRGPLWVPVSGDGRLLSEHFEIRYLSGEFDAAKAERLARLAESWYERTATFLGRRLEAGRRVLFDVASFHEVPYASEPGPEAFFLVSVRHAERDYGFSLVHELTHNLMGLSQLSQTSRDRYQWGNRLLDEGFGVYVEEKLVPEGRVFPGFGEEIHRAYLAEAADKGLPRPPILESEGLRSRRGRTVRLGYLQQSSFVKWLVESAPGSEEGKGLARFLELFGRGLDALPELYGSSLEELEAQWLAFLEAIPDEATAEGG